MNDKKELTDFEKAFRKLIGYLQDDSSLPDYVNEVIVQLDKRITALEQKSNSYNQYEVTEPVRVPKYRENELMWVDGVKPNEKVLGTIIRVKVNSLNVFFGLYEIRHENVIWIVEEKNLEPVDPEVQKPVIPAYKIEDVVEISDNDEGWFQTKVLDIQIDPIHRDAKQIWFRSPHDNRLYFLYSDDKGMRKIK
jgi:hypothetical protein